MSPVWWLQFPSVFFQLKHKLDPDSVFLEWLRFGNFCKITTKKPNKTKAQNKTQKKQHTKPSISCYSPYRTRVIFLFLKDFCSHLKKSSKEERENWLSSLSGMVTGDLFLLVSVCNYPPYTECAITCQRKVLYAPRHV